MQNTKPRADPGMRLLAQYGFSRLANQLGLKPNAVSQWRLVPDYRLIEVEQATGIPRQYLRPDLFKGMRA